MGASPPAGYEALDARGFHPKTGRLATEATFIAIARTKIDAVIVGVDNGPNTDVLWLDTGAVVSARGWTWIRRRPGERFIGEARHVITETDAERGRIPRSYRWVPSTT